MQTKNKFLAFDFFTVF